MNKFITNLLRSIFTFSILLAILSIINWQLEEKIFADENIRFPFDTETILCGNSRIQVINPNDINKCVNISTGAQPHFLTFYALKKALKTNNIKNVVFPASFDNFSSFPTKSNKTKYYLPSNRLKAYIDVIDTKELLTINYFKPNYWGLWLSKLKVPFNFDNNLKLISKFKLGKLNQDNISYYGSFHESYNSILSEEDLKKFVKRAYTNNFSYWDKKWFFKIIELCEEKNINLFIVAPPIHPKLYKIIPNRYIDNYNQIISQAIQDNSNVKFLDCTLDFYPDSCYGDGDHLNSYGAVSFSKKINSILPH